MTYKPGDRLIGYGDPIKSKTPLGWITLKSFLQETKHLELWLVEYDDQPEHFYELWIKKKEEITTRDLKEIDISMEEKNGKN
jgi:hypothetical protein